MVLGHDDMLAGHGGVDRTYHAIKQVVTWPGMYDDICHFVHTMAEPSDHASDELDADRRAALAVLAPVLSPGSLSRLSSRIDAASSSASCARSAHPSQPLSDDEIIPVDSVECLRVSDASPAARAAPAASAAPFAVAQHRWAADAQLLALEANGAHHFYLVAEPRGGADDAGQQQQQQQQQDASSAAQGHVMLYLDVSASMNHNEAGIYEAPDSHDHPASSIRKAREAIPPMVLAAVKRGSRATVVAWSYKVKHAIEFTPDQFYADADTHELSGDDDVTADVCARTSSDVFRAKGGTNIEAALADAADRCRASADRGATSVSVWLLTDGEETVYTLSPGKYEHVPTNKWDKRYQYFTERDAAGTTAYQRELAGRLAALRAELEARGVQLDFHVCFTGDAEPRFLSALRAAAAGHLHVMADVANMAREMAAQATDARSSVVVAGTQYAAAVSDGALCCRGVLSADVFAADVAGPGAVRVRLCPPCAPGERTLDQRGTVGMCEDLYRGVCAVLALEAELSDVIAELGRDVTPQRLSEAAQRLRALAAKRDDAVALVVKGGGTSGRAGSAMLSAFVEKVLEAVRSQSDALARLLGQYHAAEGASLTAESAKKNDLFKAKEREAIAAGLESMRVRLGHGFVSQASLDREVARLVALHGPRARRMMRRVVLVAETPNAAQNATMLTVAVVEGDKLSEARREMARRLAEPDAAATRALLDPESSFDYAETLQHNAEGNVVVHAEVTVRLPREGLAINLRGDFAFGDAYPSVVAVRSVRADSEALDGACKRLMDPLSFSSFLDLIREHGTLPAALYVIAPSQSAGLLFNAREALHVESGGTELTSFGYFRLFWRLAHARDASDGLVTVPGTFHKANAAMPLAPDPLSSLVLSTTMVGPMCEFVTGTPMAPLPAAGILYVGFLLLHMQSARHTPLDVERIGQILASLGCWIADPVTYPRPEEAAALVDTLANCQSVEPADSPGRFFPIKALAYAILDQRHPIERRYSALCAEMLRRCARQLLPQAPAGAPGADKRVSPQLAAQQVPIRQYLRELLERLSPSTERDADGVPAGVLATARELAALVRDDASTDGAVLGFVNAHGRKAALARAVRDVLQVRARLGFPAYAQWARLQRLMYVWAALASFPSARLLEDYAAFRKPDAFESHVARVLEHCAEQGSDDWGDSLASWVAADAAGALTHNVLLSSDSGALRLRTTAVPQSGPVSQSTRDADSDDACAMRLWAVFRAAVLSQWRFTGSPSTCYGLHEVDYDVIKALREGTTDALSQTQLSEFHAAREHRNKAYTAHVAPKPEPVRIRDHWAARQERRNLSAKPRVSVATIGNVDSGKSTILGRMVVELGFVPPHALERYERDCAALGKTSHKYAWILSRLRDERERGMTVEVGSWSIETPQREVDLIDCPGHRTFLKSMAAGASMADIALLVVSAVPGEFEAGMVRRGMTREEALVAFSQGVRRWIVVVNKMDAVAWSEARFAEVSAEVTSFLGKMGVKPRDVGPVVPLAGLDGGNLVAPAPAAASWYRGPTLLGAIDACQVPTRDAEAPLRVPILKAVMIPGVGTVAIGRVATGRLRAGAKVSLGPRALQSTAPTIELYHNQRAEALPGDLVGFTLRGVSVADVGRGAVLCDAGDRPMRAVESFVAQVVFVQLPGLLRANSRSYVHTHTASFAVSVVSILRTVDRKTGATVAESPDHVKNGDSALIELRPVCGPVCVEPFGECSALGRLVIMIIHLVALLPLPGW
eukprot:m51a1_g5739 putative elongation factor 1-alpha 1 (1748) ;mRNA; r:1147184-1156452